MDLSATAFRLALIVSLAIIASGGCQRSNEPAPPPTSAGQFEAVGNAQWTASQGDQAATTPEAKGALVGGPGSGRQGPPGGGAKKGMGGSGAKKSKGAGGRGGRPEAPLSDDEKAVKEMIDRVGGQIQRLAGSTGGSPGPLGIVRLQGTTATLADLEVLKRLGTLYDLTLEGPTVGDTSVPVLVECKTLATLHLRGKTFTDQALMALATHPTLRILVLDDVAIGKEGLASFANSDVLTHVDLVNMTITPEILTGLQQLRKIREIRFQNSPISDTELSQLRELLPDCDVTIVAEPTN